MDISSQTIRHNRFSRTHHQIAKDKKKRRRRENPLAFPDATPTRRIYSAAGQRLEEILKIDTSSTKRQENEQLRNDSQNRCLSTSRYLSLLSEEDDEAQVHGDGNASPYCFPCATSVGRLENNALCDKIETGGGGLGRKRFLLSRRHKKLAIIIPIVLALIVGLAVGLTVGLRNASKE